MRMERLCLIMLVICVSIDLGYASPAAKTLFVHSPPRLYLKPGANATFTCDISALNYKPEDINWYRTQQIPTKIADLKPSQNERIRIIPYWTQQKADLIIVNITLNDSGKYHCTHVNITASEQIIASNMSELIVSTDFPNTVTHKISYTDLPKSKQDSQTMSIICISIILAILLLLAVSSVIVLIWHKRRNTTPQCQQQNPEKVPQDPSVYTVNYGMLNFGASQAYRKSPELRVSEQVEYATIMFPQQTPSIGDRRQKYT